MTYQSQYLYHARLCVLATRRLALRIFSGPVCTTGPFGW